jgi:hypothetical protein
MVLASDNDFVFLKPIDLIGFYSLDEKQFIDVHCRFSYACLLEESGKLIFIIETMHQLTSRASRIRLSICSLSNGLLI